MSDLTDLAADAIADLGGHAPAWKIAEHMAARMSEDDYRDATWRGFVSVVRNSLRRNDSDGLPQAVSVGGEYVQTSLLNVDQFAHVVSGYVKRSRANRVMAEKFDAKCVAVHGISVITTTTDAAA